MGNEGNNFEEIKKVLEEIKRKNEQTANEFECIIKVLDVQKIGDSIEELKKNVKEIKMAEELRTKRLSDFLEKFIKVKNIWRYIINTLIILLLPAIAVFILKFFLGPDKVKDTPIIFTIGILVIGALTILGLAIALAIINKSED
jgi:hypothetical protein